MSSGNRFQRLDALFHAMDALDGAQRARRMAGIEAEDEALALELGAMLDPPERLARDEAQLDRPDGAQRWARRRTESSTTARIDRPLADPVAAGRRRHVVGVRGRSARAGAATRGDQAGLGGAIDGPGWTAWMLDLPGLEPLRSSDGWPGLQLRLDRRRAE